ncbi:MAG: hypothetical protein U0P45_11095 [Acidimicrobiales bacterium]
MAVGLLAATAVLAGPQTDLGRVLGATVVPLAVVVVVAAWARRPAAAAEGRTGPAPVGDEADDEELAQRQRHGRGTWSVLVAVWFLLTPMVAVCRAAWPGGAVVLVDVAGTMLAVAAALVLAASVERLSDDERAVERRRVLVPPAAVALLVLLGSVTGAFHWEVAPAPRPMARPYPTRRAHPPGAFSPEAVGSCDRRRRPAPCTMTDTAGRAATSTEGTTSPADGDAPPSVRLPPTRPDHPARPRSMRPAPIHRISELPDQQRLIARAVLVGMALLPLLSAAVVLWQGWRPMGDNALIGLRVHDVLTGHFPLIGQPTTGENFGSGVTSSHPGPIEFYLVAPFVAVLGPIVGLALGAAAINATAFVLVGWLGFRRGGLPLMALSSVSVLAMARSLGGNLLHDPVSSNVGSFMALALLYAAWSIVAGDLRLTPVFVACGTFSLQDHLTYLGTLTPVVLLGIGVGSWWLVRIRRRSRAPWLRRTAVISAVLAVVLWLPVVIDQLWGDQNISAILRTFTGKRTAGEGVTFALERLVVALAPAPLPAFARRFAPLGYLHTPDHREMALGVLVLLALLVGGVASLRRKDAARAAMAAVALLAAVAGTYSAVKLPVGAGVQGSNLRWMWTVSAFSWVAIAWIGWSFLPAFGRDVLRTPAWVAIGLATLLIVAGTVQSIGLQTDRDGRSADEATELIGRVEARLPKGRYKVSYAGGSVVVSVGPALVHALDHRGDTVLMDVGPFTRAYADHRAYDGQPVDGTVVITSEATTTYDEDTTLLGRQDFAVNRKDGAVNTVRVYLVRS